MLREAFHQEVRELEKEVMQMASLVESAIARAMQSLLQHDTIQIEPQNTTSRSRPNR